MSSTRLTLHTLTRTVLLIIALLVPTGGPALAQEAQEEGRRESPPRFSPPEEMLERSRGVAERASVGAIFRIPVTDRLQRTESVPDWVSLGPTPIGSEYWSGNTPASGRVNSIVVDPRNASVAYCAAAYGGVWKTTNGGALWVPLTDALTSLSSGALALDPVNPDIVWYGTGEQNFAIDSYGGDGLFRSADGGASWAKIATTSSVGSYIARVVVHPTTPTTLFVASERGVVRSLNSGSTWTVVQSASWCTDLVQNPANPSILYAAFLYGAVYRSIDGGTTWSPLGGLPASGVFRVNLAISPSNPDVVMAGVGSSSTYSLLGMYRTSDGGASWRQLVGTPDYLGGQGFYNNVVAFDPADSSVAFAGGVFPYSAGRYGVVRTINAGTAWTDVTKAASTWVHPDIHAIAFGPDGRMWVGCDGGVWTSMDRGTSWTNVNSTLSITQFYTLALQTLGGSRIVGGTQDNGTLQYTGIPSWTESIVGDGGPVDFNKANSSVFYATYTYMNPLYRSQIAGGNSSITGPWTSDRASWANGGLAAGPNGALLVGTYRVWRSINDGGTWTAISGDLTGGSGVIQSVAEAAGNTNFVAAGTSDGRVQVTTDLSVWNRRDTGLSGGSVLSLAIDPTDQNDLVVCAYGSSGARVFASGDAGVTWSSVTGDLPANLPTTWVAVDFRTTPWALYVGTWNGVYASIDGGTHWARSGASLPGSAVLGVQVDAAHDQLVAATHGRGMWRITVPVVPRPRISGVSPAFRRALDATMTLTVAGTNFRPGAIVRIDDLPRATTFVNASRLTAMLLPGDHAVPGAHVITVQGPDPFTLVSAGMAYTVLPGDSACCLFTDANVARLAGAAGATAVASADFDGDGIEDLAFARQDANQVVILRGQADGAYLPAATLPVSSPRDIAATDFNGDGLPDLAMVQTTAARVNVLYNAGGFTFPSADSMAAGVAPARVAVADLDNDGRPDLVVGQTGPYLVRFFNDGPGTAGAVRAWRRADLVKTPFSSPMGIALADLDRDGYLDYFVGNRNTSIAALVSGAASFSSRSLASGPAGMSAASGFFNNDSLPDVAIPSASDSIVSIFRNTAGGTFVRTVTPARRGPLDVEAVDVDGDGAVDLALPCAVTQTLTLLLGRNDGTFAAPLDFDAGRRPSSVAARSDRLRLAVADSLGDPTVLRLDARLKPMAFATGDGPADLVVADLDGDLNPDMVTGNGDGTVSVLFGRGDATCLRRVALSTGAAVQAVALADLDGDTRLDIIAALVNGTVAMWRNAGSRVFTAQPSASVAPGARDLWVGDADGAGDALDLVITTATGVTVALHGGGFAFTPLTPVAAPPDDPFGVARARDLDGDSVPDLIVGADGAVYVFHGTGAGAFDPSSTRYDGGPGARALALADLDGDGAADLVLGSRVTGEVSVRRAIGGGAFGTATLTPAGIGISHLVLADVSGDGFPDAVMADSANGRLMVLAGNGNGTFGPCFRYRSGRGASAVVVGDMDRDGHADAVLAARTDALAFIHVKNGPAPPLAVEDAARQPSLAFTDLHPNPASGRQEIRFTVPRLTEGDLRVFDIAGRSVATLARGPFAAGEHVVVWDGHGANGAAVAPGVYFVRLRCGAEHLTRRVARVR